MTFGYDDDFTSGTGATSLMDGLARRVSGEARADTVFGDPITQDGVTVIPVAKVRWGFGGGAGSGADEGEDAEDFGEGGGGAGAVSAKPLGYIEISDGRTTFRPVEGPARFWPIVAAGVAAWLGLRALRR